MGIFDFIRGLLGSGSNGTGASGPDGDGSITVPANVEPGERVPFGAMVAGSREELREKAEEFAAAWSEFDLDFTPSSVRGVDEMYATQQDRANFLTVETDDGYTGSFAPMASQPAIYFGETIVRNYDAEWVFDEDFGWALQFGDGEIVNLFKTAHTALESDPPFVMLHDTFVETGGLDGDPLDADGGRARRVQVDEGIDPDDFDDEEIAAAASDRDGDELVDDVRDDAEDFVARWPSYDLDYSAASLKRVDDLVATEFDTPEFADAEVGSTDDEASITLTAHASEAGAYFGEVLSRTTGGSWHYSESDGLRVSLPVPDGMALVSPHAMAESCLTGDDTFAGRYAEVQAAVEEIEAELDDVGSR